MADARRLLADLDGQPAGRLEKETVATTIRSLADIARVLREHQEQP